jgi:F-type H+-transporting ATPase subunit b
VSIEHDATFFALVAFVIFIALIFFLGVPDQINGALDQRKVAIQRELDDAKRLRREAEELKAEYERRRVAAQIEAKAIVEAAKAQAQRVAEETRAAVQAEIARRTKQAEESIARAEQQATAEVRSAAVEAAITAAEKTLRSGLNADAQARLVNEGVKELAAKFA